MATVDIYLIGDPSQGEQKLRELFHLMQQVQKTEHGANSRMLVTRSNAAVTIFRATSPNAEANPPPVQLVLHNAESLPELLSRFDCDCCCVAWVGGRVLASARGIRALRHCANIVDSRFASPSFCRRLEKYASRGFAVAIPSLEVRRFKADMFTRKYAWLPKHDLLLRCGHFVRDCIKKKTFIY